MQKKHYYFVVGHGQFPDDMLRYDQAEIVGTTHMLGKVAYLIYGLCTIGRWQSFLWSVFPAARYYPNGDSEHGPVEWKVQIQGNWEKVPVRNAVKA